VPLFTCTRPEKVLAPESRTVLPPVTIKPPPPVRLLRMVIPNPSVSRVERVLAVSLVVILAGRTKGLVLMTRSVPPAKFRFTVPPSGRIPLRPSSAKVPELRLMVATPPVLLPIPSSAWKSPPFSVSTPGAGELPPISSAPVTSTRPPGPTVKLPGEPKPMLNWPLTVKVELAPVTTIDPVPTLLPMLMPGIERFAPLMTFKVPFPPSPTVRAPLVRLQVELLTVNVPLLLEACPTSTVAVTGRVLPFCIKRVPPLTLVAPV